MPLSLDDLHHVATDVAREEDRTVEVIGALSAEGSSDYAEIIVTRHGAAPKCAVIGVSRHASDVRTEFRDGLRRELGDSR